MTTITIDRKVLVQALNALLLPCDRWNGKQFLIVKAAVNSVQNALAAPATAPDELERRDAERVAWYENNPEKVLNIGFRWYSRNGYGLPMKRRKGFREAIDAAMKETP